MTLLFKKILARIPFVGGIVQIFRKMYLSRQVIANETGHEIDMQFLKKIVFSGDLVIDVGANIGLYTKLLSGLTSSSGKVFAFEPISKNLAVLRDVIKKAPLGNVQCFHGAVSSSTGNAEVFVPETGTFTGFYLARFAKDDDKGEREKVVVYSLDELWQTGQLPNVDFIKCDVEGAESEVVAGARNLIEKVKPSWLIEVSKETSEAVFDFFHAQGYSAFVYEREN